MKKTRLYMDSEFTGLHRFSTFISLAFLTDDGRHFYAEFSDYARDQIDSWIRKNVLDKLVFSKPMKGQRAPYERIMHDSIEAEVTNIKYGYSLKLRNDRRVIRAELLNWLSQFNEVEIYMDFYSYDWVLLADLFGGALEMSTITNIYYIPQCLCSHLKVSGFDPDVTREDFAKLTDKYDWPKHNALHDVRVIRQCYKRLEELSI